MRSKSISAIAAALAAVVVLSGCASDAPTKPAPTTNGDSGSSAHGELVKLAQDEGKVVWYTPNAPDKVERVSERFEELYGIQVETFRGPSSKAIQRYESERDANAPVVDVLDIGTYSPFLDNEADFVNLRATPLESLRDWPEDAFWGGKGVAVNTGLNPLVIMYNTDLVSESQVPKTWPEMMNNKLGPIATPNMAAADVWVMFLDFLDNEYGDKVLTDFAKADRTAFDSAIPAMQGVASGEYTLGIGVPSQAEELIKAGAPIDFFVPELTTYSARATGVPTSAPHPNAALLFMDFIMSAEGQTITAGVSAASVLASVDTPIKISPKAVPMDEKRSLENRDRILKLAGF